MSTSFHPQTDGQTERANRNIGQIFRAVVRHNQKDWVDRVNLTEFAINASITEMTRFAPFELNGGYMPSMMKEIRSDEAIPRGIKLFAETALQNLTDTHDAIIEACVFQTSHTNARRKMHRPIGWITFDLVPLDPSVFGPTNPHAPTGILNVRIATPDTSLGLFIDPWAQYILHRGRPGMQNEYYDIIFD